MSKKQEKARGSAPQIGARSLKAPSIGLGKAVESVCVIHAKENRSDMTRDLVAKHMGYTSAGSGTTLGALSSLFKFGLLEGKGSQVRVSDLGVTIAAYRKGDPERAQAVKVAASKPALFAELDERSKSSTISDDNIASYLISKLGFSKASAASAVRVYRQTKKFLAEELEGVALSTLGEESEGEHTKREDEAVTGPMVDKPRVTPHVSPTGGYAPPLEKGVEREVYILEEGRVELIFPKNLSPASAGDLAGYLGVFINKVNRMATPKDPTSEGSEDGSLTDAGGGDDEN
ncbi:MAG: hypothetical protein MPJ52_01030 [Alphaproteobacteria bacterium]|nr:hypothetical protein [Alphaproteobacteria bacterium]